MRNSLAACGALVLGLLFAETPGVAHHPIAPEFDADREITLRGTVEKFEWTSPHALLELEAKAGDQEQAKTWTIELDGESALDSLGWNRNTLTQGQHITVNAWPARDGSARAVAWAVELEDGRELAAINPHDPAWTAYAERRNAQSADRDQQRAQGAAPRDQQQAAQGAQGDPGDRQPQAAQAERRDQQPAQAEREVAFIGCIELERDFRQRADAGRGGVLGTGLGLGNEFVLVDARPAPEHLAQSGPDQADPVGTAGDTPRDGDRADAGRQAQPGATADAIGTSGEAETYSLTGSQEGNLAQAVGRQVHVIGVLENEGRDQNAGQVDRAGELPRISVTAWHPVNDFCPAQPEQGIAQPQGGAAPQGAGQPMPAQPQGAGQPETPAQPQGGR